MDALFLNKIILFEEYQVPPTTTTTTTTNSKLLDIEKEN